MKAIHDILLKIQLVLIVFGTSLATQAQDKIDSLSKTALGIGAADWQLSGNAIFLRSAGIPEYAQVGFQAQHISGAFRRPQDFQQQNSLAFGATGLSQANNWLFYGAFSYGKKYSDSIRFANVAYPYDGNPFITADAVGGNWRGDNLNAGLQVVAPAVKNWQAAVKLAYATEQNSRNNDPRPLNRLLNYHIQPSIAYAFKKKHLISVLGGYSFHDETIETGYNSDENPIIYSIRGYGEYSSGPVVTAQRFTKGHGLDLGADYRYTANTEWLIGARFAYRTQDVNEGIAKPIFIGGFDETSAKAFIGFFQERDFSGWRANLQGWFRDGTGFDPVFNSVNPASYFSGIDGTIAYWMKNDRNRLLQFSFYPGLSYTNFFEGIAKTDWSATMLHQDAAVSWIIHPVNKLTLTGELKMGYHLCLKEEIVINRPSALSPILVRPYHQFASGNYLKGALQLSAVYRAPSVAYQLGGSLDLRKTENLGNRSTSSLSLSLIF